MATNATEAGNPTGEATVTDKQRIRFTRDEIPRLLGLFGFIALLHGVGFGLFYYYNSQPRYPQSDRRQGHVALRRGGHPGVHLRAAPRLRRRPHLRGR